MALNEDDAADCNVGTVVPRNVIALFVPLKSVHVEQPAALTYKTWFSVTPAPGQNDPVGHVAHADEAATT